MASPNEEIGIFHHDNKTQMAEIEQFKSQFVPHAFSRQRQKLSGRPAGEC